MTDERRRLQHARTVVHGDTGDGTGGRLAYAAYLAVLLLATYGFTVAQALFRTSDPTWLREQLTSGPGIAVLALSAVALAVTSFWAGTVRGPVAPQLPWVDHVVTSDLDRRTVLRGHWRVGLGAGVVAGLLVGATLGLAVWFAKVGGPLGAALVTAAGTALGGVCAYVWLLGQARQSRPGPGRTRYALSPAQVLADVDVDALRTQAVRSDVVGGAVLTGDLRAARLEVAAPVTRSRGRRLRPGHPVTTMVRRDLLGLRRSPWRVGSGAALGLPAAAVLTWSASSTRVSLVVPILAGLALYVGADRWAEGLRQQADNAGAPPLLGLSPRREALAHAVLPTVLTAAVLALGAGAAVLLGDLDPVLLGWAVLLAPVCTGASMIGAFRGTPPGASLDPQTGMIAMLIWYSRPFLLATAATGLGAHRYAANGPVVGCLGIAAAGVGAVVLGVTSARSAYDLHRD